MPKRIILPGLVDVHTHLRVPGGEHKEDFRTGTAAALAGGITTILAMPNTSPPLSTPDVLVATRQQAAQDIRCDVGLFAGASPEAVDQLADCAPYAGALKIYLNDTFGPLRVEDVPTLMACFATWPRDKMIAMHAEKQSVAVGIGLAAAYNRPVHFCHISRRQEIELIAQAKAQGLPITCEVTPHHLFLTRWATCARCWARPRTWPHCGIIWTKRWTASPQTTRHTPWPRSDQSRHHLGLLAWKPHCR